MIILILYISDLRIASNITKYHHSHRDSISLQYCSFLWLKKLRWIMRSRQLWCTSVSPKNNSGFELTYRFSGNTIHFSFFRTQFFPRSLKITIPKHNIKRKNNFLLNLNHKEKLCFTEFSTRIYWNRSLVASVFYFLFRQSKKFCKFYWHMLKKRLFIKWTDNEEWLLLSASCTAKLELVLVLIQESTFS